MQPGIGFSIGNKATNPFPNCKKEIQEMSMDEEHFVVYESSIGYIIIVTKNGKVISLDVRSGGMYGAKKIVSSLYPEATESITPFKAIRTLLDRYLQGREVDFEIEVDISHLGVFTQKVLNELRKIPFGETRSYGWLAKKIGKAEAARAVGQALKRNPIPIIIPCHRVIRDDGTIGGFSMGVNIKERLLALEGVHLARAK
jgi:methylated-DNA-[protein]-cysteine S-methyltransferase